MENFIKSINDFAKSIRELNSDMRIFHYIYNDIRDRKLLRLRGRNEDKTI